jgi:hypothetical protein
VNHIWWVYGCCHALRVTTLGIKHIVACPAHLALDFRRERYWRQHLVSHLSRQVTHKCDVPAQHSGGQLLSSTPTRPYTPTSVVVRSTRALAFVFVPSPNVTPHHCCSNTSIHSKTRPYTRAHARTHTAAFCASCVATTNALPRVGSLQHGLCGWRKVVVEVQAAWPEPLVVAQRLQNGGDTRRRLPLHAARPEGPQLQAVLVVQHQCAEERVRQLEGRPDLVAL